MYQLMTRFPYGRPFAARNHSLRAAALAPSMLAHSTFNGLQDVLREIDRQSRLYDAPGKTPPSMGAVTQEKTKLLRIPLNIWESDSAFFVEAEIPGVSADDIEIAVEANRLTISGTRSTLAAEQEPAQNGEVRADAGAEAPRSRWSERYSGDFRRIVELPCKVDAENVDATLTHGVLTLTVPKIAAQGPKKIRVSAK